HKAEPVDLLITKAAFHHLPDFWKQIALLKMNKMIKIGGILYIHDVVFNFEAAEYKDKIDNWISFFEKNAGEKFKEEVETHIREEYSAFKWVLDGMLERAGFRIENCRSNDSFVTEYHCVKVKAIDMDE
ncbi:MAG: class I SAM-dependent methyltransferase, partial [Bacillota bacterium]|nr:class I SAM-dependent methyltransferase [Bacillota bacterium]